MSARTGDGIPQLEAELAALLPEGPAYFEPGVDSDQPLERRIAELVREQALARTREEVPHAIAVIVDEIKPPRGKHAGRVTATLIVEADEPAGHPRRQGRRHRARHRHGGAAGDRGAARRQASTST